MDRKYFWKVQYFGGRTVQFEGTSDTLHAVNGVVWLLVGLQPEIVYQSVDGKEYKQVNSDYQYPSN